MKTAQVSTDSLLTTLKTKVPQVILLFSNRADDIENV